jgi:hypothetical protein
MDPKIWSSRASSSLLSLKFPFAYIAKTAISISTLDASAILFGDAVRDVRGDRYTERLVLVCLNH